MIYDLLINYIIILLYSFFFFFNYKLYKKLKGNLG